MEFFLKIILAHLLADFLFQPSAWVRHKEKFTWRSPYLYAHVGIYLLLTLLFLGFERAYWLPAAGIALSHLLIDLLKCMANKNWQKRVQLGKATGQFPLYSFLVDQALHISLLVLWAFNAEEISWSLFTGWNFLHWMLLLCLLLLTQVSAVIIRLLVARWIPQVPSPDWTLQNAGTFIGMLERLMVFAFVVTGHWEGIGFLIAAKSVLRYGDLKDVKDRRLTEYVLIGTLLSFGIGLAVGLLYLQVSG
jgi:hypothetical protein